MTLTCHGDRSNLLKQYYDDCSHVDDIGLPIPAKDKEINDLKSEVNNFVEFLLAKRKKELKKKSPRYGSAKGQIYMSADFDDPLEDFKAYM